MTTINRPLVKAWTATVRKHARVDHLQWVPVLIFPAEDGFRDSIRRSDSLPAATMADGFDMGPEDVARLRRALEGA